MTCPMSENEFILILCITGQRQWRVRASKGAGDGVGNQWAEQATSYEGGDIPSGVRQCDAAYKW